MNKKIWIIILFCFIFFLPKTFLWCTLTSHSVCSFPFIPAPMCRTCLPLLKLFSPTTKPRAAATLKRCSMWCKISSILFFSCTYLYLFVGSVVTEYMCTEFNDLIRIITISASSSRIISVCWNLGTLLL